MQNLREEIVAAQMSRSDLLKWKLIIVSVLASVGLGIKVQAVDGLHLSSVLLVIPFASLYVDALCYHLALRTTVIGTFLKCCEVHTYPSSASSELPIFHNYEKFASRVRGRGYNAFKLEDWALSLSTVVLSAVVALYGVAIEDGVYCLAFIAVGMLGAACAILLLHQFNKKTEKVAKCTLP